MFILDVINYVAGTFYTYFLALGDICFMSIEEYFTMNSVEYVNVFTGDNLTIYMGDWFSTGSDVILWIVDNLMPNLSRSDYVIYVVLSLSFSLVILIAFFGIVTKVVQLVLPKS